MNLYLEAAIKVFTDYVIALDEFMRKERTAFDTFIDPVAQVFVKIGPVCGSFSVALTIILGATSVVFADGAMRRGINAAFYVLLLGYWIVVSVHAQMLRDEILRERRRNQQ